MADVFSLDMKGETSRSGTRFARFSREGQPVMRLSFSDCSPERVVEELAKRGTPLHGKLAIARINQELANLRDFPPAQLVDHLS